MLCQGVLTKCVASEYLLNNLIVFLTFKKHRKLLINTVYKMSATYRPSKLRRARSCGFRKRMKTPSGRIMLRRRRQKGRWRLTSSDEK